MARAYEWIAVVLILLLYLPILFIFSGSLSIASLLEVLQTAKYYHMLSFTLLQATLSTLASLAIAMPLAYIISHYRFIGRAFIRTLTLIPFVLPSILLVLGVVLVWGNNGWINQLLGRIFPADSAGTVGPVLPILYSLPGIVLAHTLYNFGICARLVSERWQLLPHAQLQAARTLGAGSGSLVRDIVLPWLTPSILASASIIFLLSFTSFATVLVLGGGPWHSSLEVAIYRLIKIEFDVSSAAQLAFIQLCITLSITLSHLFGKKQTMAQEMQKSLPSLLKSKCYWGILYLWLILAFVLLPFLAILFLSFRLSSSRSKNSMDIFAYKELFTQGIQPLYTSITVSLSAMSFALAAGSYISIALNKLHAKTARLLELLLFIPYCISPVVLSLGYSYLRQWLGIRPTWILFLVHGVLALPLVVRILLVSRRSIRDDITLAAKNLGASPLNIGLSIHLPLLMPAILTAASLAMSLSLGELNAALMLLPSNMPSIPLAMYQLMGHYRIFDASRFGVLLMLSTALMLLLIRKVGSLFSRRSKNVMLL